MENLFQTNQAKGKLLNGSEILFNKNAARQLYMRLVYIPCLSESGAVNLGKTSKFYQISSFSKLM